MSEKRRDNKGRVLHSCEFQKSDGRYEFRYTDTKGVKKSVYSWKLVSTDKVPAGKRSKESLRDIEKRITRDTEDDIEAHNAYNLTLNYCFDEYIKTKYELKQSTLGNYIYMYNSYVREGLGLRKISSIKYSDIKKFYIYLVTEIGFKPNSVEVVHTVLHPVFTTAVRDCIIRTNPTDGVMAELKKSQHWNKTKRHALTVPQQEAFVNFVKNSRTYNCWLPLFTFLLGTGCRIGEAIGIRWCDCDFDNNIISINHSIIYRPQLNGMCRATVSTPKTEAGCRIIPMMPEVKNALIQERKRQSDTNLFNKDEIDGYKDFVFTNRFGSILLPTSVNRVIIRIIKDHNQQELEVAEKENRSPVLIPHFSVHNLRHTFCTRFCENETNIKVIQEIMGHADITTTMDIYNEATAEKKIESFANLSGKIKIS